MNRITTIRRLEVGSIFLESDGPYEVMKREIIRKTLPDSFFSKTFDYHLRKLTPEEVICYEVLSS